MFIALSSGFFLGLSLILAIGAQNAFVLKQGLRGEHVLAVVLACAISDALLIAAGVAGFGALVEAAPWIYPVMRFGGAAFLFFYAARSLYAAFKKQDEALDPSTSQVSALWPVLMTCLMLTWLNPHVYLDTLVLLGSISATHGENAWWFGLGAMVSSFVFFASLGFGAALLRPLFARPIAWRILDVLVAIVMASIGVSLIL